MSDRRLSFVLALSLVVGFGAKLATAQITVVTLKDGTKVEGFIVEESAASVKLTTPDGKTLKYPLADIQSQEETKRTGSAELDSKLEAIDRSDVDALAKVASWAKEQKIRAWEFLAREVLKADPKNEMANTLLGYTKVGDRWYRSQTEANAARKAESDAEMKAKGMVRVQAGAKSGWISKENKALFDKDRTKFDLDDTDGVFKPLEEVMKSRGMVLVKGKWVRAGSADDEADMAKFKDLVKEDVWIRTYPHFRLCMMQFSPEKVDEYAKLCEETYAWFLKEMGKPADFPLWPKPAELWVFKDKNVKNEWLKHWRNRFGFDEDTYKFFIDAHNFVGDLLGGIVTESNDDIRYNLVHMTGHFLIRYFARGLKGTPPWLVEAWANHCEHVKLGNGHVACTTKADYGDNGGKADKGKFGTKDAKDRCKAMLREGSDEPMTNLSKLDLNSLNGDHLAKGWSMIEWLFNNRRKEFIDWLEGTNIASQEEALSKAIDGWGFDKLDGEWRAYVKKKY